MRLISPGGTAPAAVNRYMLPHEHQVVTIRRHPIVLFPWAASAAGGVLVAVATSAIEQERRSVQLTVWALTIFLAWESISAVGRWLAGYIVVTNSRVIVCSGFLGRRIESTPIESLKGMMLDRSFSGRYLGYGTLIVDGRRFIDYVPYPEQFYLEIMGLVFPAGHSVGTSGD